MSALYRFIGARVAHLGALGTDGYVVTRCGRTVGSSRASRASAAQPLCKICEAA